MAFPFGGQPTLAQYMHWIRECGGSAQSGISQVGERMQTLTKITADNGNVVIIAGIKQTEHLVASMVGYLDRRLGVKSPWISLQAD
jgi:hypothetical protein